MYRYDDIDKAFVQDRTEQFRGQVARRLAGEITEDQFKPLRLMNGLYLQLHAYMLRVSIPYGNLTPTKLRKLALIARQYDKGYGHFTTRQNIQFHWMKLKDVPDVLDHLAGVEMHALQTSGNCIRNVTADPRAGASADELDDGRVWAEVIRQWGALHPEFSFLPRKFKIAVTGSLHDRTAVRLYDIGVALRKGRNGQLGFEVMVGGGLGRTPYLGTTIREFLPTEHLLSYLEAILRVYNRHGRRDNIWKARIKILVNQLGGEEFARQVEAEWAQIDHPSIDAPAAEVERIRRSFVKHTFEALPARSETFEAAKAADPAFARFARHNVHAHREPGYAFVEISLKAPGETPGDITDVQMEAVADLGERYSLGEIRNLYEQNLALPHVKLDDVYTVYQGLKAQGLATSNMGLISDIIACPGLDYCALANARAIPIAQDIAMRFADAEKAEAIGELKIKISGCINACGHHHVGHIGILGVDKKGEEFYQVTVGGSGGDDAELGKIIGPALAADQVGEAVEKMVAVYMAERQAGERFLDTTRRIGLTPFKEAVYAEGH